MSDGFGGELLRRTLERRIYRQSRRLGMVRAGDALAPGNRNQGAQEDITDAGVDGFAITGGASGGFETNPEVL